jgi:hypothetical protein
MMNNYYAKIFDKLESDSRPFSSHIWNPNDDKSAYDRLDSILKGLTGLGMEDFEHITIRNEDMPRIVDLTHKSLNQCAAELFGISRYYKFRVPYNALNSYAETHFALVIENLEKKYKSVDLRVYGLAIANDQWKDYEDI